MFEFKPFNKIARLSRECVITEKIDGTNASIHITEDGQFLVGSRTRLITPENDNYGFAKWAYGNKEELMKLGVGSHFGEWWGKSIQRGYNLVDRRFSLFNVAKWSDDSIRPECCGVVPLLRICEFDTALIYAQLELLKQNGSQAHPGYMFPEGIVIFHKASGQLFKKTIEGDDKSKFEL